MKLFTLKHVNHRTTETTMGQPSKKHHNSMEHARARKQPAKGKVDLTYLQDLADGDENFVNEVIAMFLSNTPDILKQVMLYHKSGNYPLLKTSVHKLKSSLRMLGNEQLSLMAQTIEDQVHLNQIDKTLHTIVKAFVTKSTQFLDSLSAELDNRLPGSGSHS